MQHFGRGAATLLLLALSALTCGLAPAFQKLTERVDELEAQLAALPLVEVGTVVLGPEQFNPSEPQVLKADVCFSEPYASTPTVTISLRDASLPGQTLHALTPFASTPSSGCFAAVLAMPYSYQGGHALLSWHAIGER